MQEHEIISAKCLQRGKTFPLIIGVNKPGSTLNMYRTQSGIVTYTIDQVDCCYYRTCPYIRIHLLKSKHRWAISLAPRPYGIGNRSALLFMTFVQWMRGKQFLWSEYQGVNQISCLAWRHLSRQCGVILIYRSHEEITPLLSGIIVRRRGHNAFVTTFYNQKMAVLHPREKLYTVTS